MAAVKYDVFFYSNRDIFVPPLRRPRHTYPALFSSLPQLRFCFFSGGGGEFHSSAFTKNMYLNLIRSSLKKCLRDVKASGGLLLGLARAAYRRGEEMGRLQRDLDRADSERKKFRELLDKATNDKRNVSKPKTVPNKGETVCIRTDCFGLVRVLPHIHVRW